MTIYWFGYGGSAYLAEEIRPIINELGMELVTIHEHDNANIKWERSTWLGHLKQADIIIIPMCYEIQPAKSNNRLTQSLSMGKPIVCSPLAAYVRIEKDHPGCCLFAKTPEEWRDQLMKLRDDANLRQDMYRKAIEAAKSYSLDSIGAKWINVLKDTQEPKTDIVIPTYKNLRGLKLCLDSIKACTQDTLYNIIVVNNGTNQAMHDYLNGRGDIQYIKIGKSNFAQAVNTGIKAGSGDYVLILNDDVIASKGWLGEMVRSCQGDVGAVGPLSNCDYGWLHSYRINIGGVELLPGVNTFEEIEPIIGQIYDYRSPYNEMPAREWAAFYCTLIPRAVIDKVGYLNEEYTNSGEDVDLCRRIRKCGYRIIQNYKSFLFHFGAVSRKFLEAEDPGSYQAADKQTNEHLRKLWGKKSVMIYSGPAWERFDHRNLETTGIGGSEVWLIWISRKLSELGYRVTVFADCPQRESLDGEILWLHYNEYPKWVEQHWSDYAILSRTTDPLRSPLRAGRIYVISHDVWLLSPKDQLFLDKVNKYCVLSKWHWDFFRDYHKIPEEKMCLTSNGIDPDRFDRITTERHPYRFHWSSSWDRGLDNVLYLLPFIKNEVPELELHIFYGCHNWKQNCIQKNDTEGLKKIENLEEQMKQSGVFNHGRVDQNTLAKEIKKASLLLYPSWFSETWFISGIECQYAGVPVICNNYAGVITTLGNSAILLGPGDAWWPYSKEGRESFLRKSVEILTDNRLWKEWSEKGIENAKRHTWDQAALQWDKLFKE